MNATPRSTSTQGSSNDDGLLDALVQSAFVVMGVLNRVGADHDLSLTQLRVLAILRDRRVRVTALADYLGLEKSTLTGLVNRAEHRGLLRREPNELDGRAVDVVLTAVGAELAARLQTEVAASLSPRFAHLARVERRRLQTLVERSLGQPS